MSSNPTSFRLPTAYNVPTHIEHNGEKIALPTQIRDNIRMLFNGLLDAHQAIVALNGKQVTGTPETIVNNITNVAAAPVVTPTADYFVGPGLLYLPTEGASILCHSNNEVRVWMFSLAVQVTVGHITSIGQAFAGTPNVGTGIYDLSGNALVTTVFTWTNLNPVTNTVGPVTITPGSYYLAQSSSDWSNTQGWVAPSSFSSAYLVYANHVKPRVGFAANGMSVTPAMPATLGTITADVSNIFPPLACIFGS